MEQNVSVPQNPSPAPVAKPPKKKKKKHIKRIVFLVLIVLVLALALGFFYLRIKSEYTVTYQEYTASTGTISNALSFSGNLQLIHNTEYTASSDTTVRSVMVTLGQEVREGDLLLKLRNGQTIEAEFDGRVNQLPVKEDEKVLSGDLLVQVVDFVHMKVAFRVDEYNIGEVQPGDPCRITATATEKVFESDVAEINYVSSSAGNVAYYTATAYVEVSEGIYPGMQVTVTVPQEEARDVVVLSENALSFNNRNEAFVYMMNPSGELFENYVTTGVSNGNYVEIRSGLSEGDSVYAVVTESAASDLSSLLSGVFGSQRINSTGGRNSNSNWNNTRNTNNRTPGGGSNGNGGAR